MHIGILTDFISHDPAYSLCGVVLNQLKMLSLPKIPIEITVFVRGDPNKFSEVYAGLADRVVQLNPGETGSNEVIVTEKSGDEIDALVKQYDAYFAPIDIMLTHDLIYQANMWKYHVAARRYESMRPELRWLHWVHSSTSWNVADDCGRFAVELDGKIANSKIVAFHPEEIDRKGTIYGYERDEILVIPNPYDVRAYYHPAAVRILDRADFWNCEILAVYPARLDRGKQVEVIGEIFRELRNARWDARVIVVDFHSTGGDKPVYRDELKVDFGDFMYFTSETEHDLSYRVPHEAVLNLFEYADVFVHPSKSEADPLTIPEAEWFSNLLVLNFDLPLMRQWQGRAVMGKFSSNFDINTGMPGETITHYDSRRDYMRNLAGAIIYHMGSNMILEQHRRIRNERSLEAVFWKKFWPAIAGGA